MTSYTFGDGITRVQTTVRGHLLNAPGITQQAPEWWPLRDRIYDAARAAIAVPHADFHVLYRSGPGQPVVRQRWTLDAEWEGPTLAWHEDTSGESVLQLRLLARAGRQQFRLDPDRPMPGAGELADVQTAVLAQHVLGNAPLVIPVDDQAAPLRFTALEIDYTDGTGTPVRAPYTSAPWGYAFPGITPNPVTAPAVWIVPAGATVGTKVSRCLDIAGEWWDDPDEPTPEFDELPPPTQHPI